MSVEWILCGAALAGVGAAIYFWRRSARLAGALAAEKEHTFSQSCEMAEKAIALLELKESLEAEQLRSAKLLRNLLPERVIAELRDTGRSTPERFGAVTVFFSDIVGFTRRSAELPPETILSELTELFSQFDRIFKANHCERIKTIGDAYLAVAGLPEEDALRICGTGSIMTKMRSGKSDRRRRSYDKKQCPRDRGTSGIWAGVWGQKRGRGAEK